ncbi:MAG: YceI family protein [Pseudomonadota bacterium]
MLRSTVVALALLGLPLPLAAEPATYTIDAEHAVIAFLVKHAGYASVMGRFSGVEGMFEFDQETNSLGTVSVTIDANTVDTGHEGRDNHVRSADFLDAGAHPDITFTATGGTVETGTTGIVEGELTVRGVTQPVTLDVTLNQVADYPCCHGKETVGISARGSFNRSDFGSTYALPTFVGDRVDVILEIEAIRAD